jgi:hypothetical protein
MMMTISAIASATRPTETGKSFPWRGFIRPAPFVAERIACASGPHSIQFSADRAYVPSQLSDACSCRFFSFLSLNVKLAVDKSQQCRGSGR